MSKQAGRFSESANDFLSPMAPTNIIATDVGTNQPYNNAAASVAFSLPGNSPAADSYTVTSSGGQTATGASSPIVVTGLSSNTSYTFTVVATNTKGSSLASSASSSITVTSVPQAPNASLSSPNANEDQVAFSANATGGKPITSFQGTGSSEGSFSGATTSPAAVAVTANVNEYFTVYAVNANGPSLGTTTNAVTTTAPFFPPYFPYFPPFFPYFPPYFPYFPYFPPYFPYFPPYFPFFPYFPPYFPYFPPYFPYFPYFPSFGPSFPYFPSFGPHFCVFEDTLILTPEGEVLAKEIKIGDKVNSYSFNELPNSEVEYDPATWSSIELTGAENVIAEIDGIKIHEVETTLTFNNDPGKRFSLDHVMLIKKDGTYMFVQASVVEVGDILISSFNGQTEETPVESINFIDEKANVYEFRVTPYDLFIAGGLITHNRKFRFQGPTELDASN
ncbi:Fibronectin type III [uncultured Caudovirales phage]|uniref:Fibronectin type III n=1 Tax=uncultured Caudovirales phage TaxID=2100421 RepID=A0A6J7WJY2_9CAUD|nr:Fibronectin type III [uncultured Caudovirales phage]